MSRNGEARRYCQKPTLLGGNNPHFRRSQWATDAWPPSGGFRLRSHSQSMTGLIVPIGLYVEVVQYAVEDRSQYEASCDDNQKTREDRVGARKHFSSCHLQLPHGPHTRQNHRRIDIRKSVIDREMIALICVFLTTLVSPFKSKSGRRLRARLVDRFG